MSADKIDHAAEAIGLRTRASAEMLAAGQANLLAAAQVHATLALVEQQRLANEIAFMRLALGMIHNGKATDVDDDGLQALADRVTKGLGL